MKSHAAIHDTLATVRELLARQGKKAYPFPSVWEEHEKGVVEAAIDAYCSDVVAGVSPARSKEMKEKVWAVYDAVAHMEAAGGAGPEETYRVVSKVLRTMSDCRGLLGKADGAVEVLCAMTSASLGNGLMLAQLTPLDLERMHECLTAAERALREGASS